MKSVETRRLNGELHARGGNGRQRSAPVLITGGAGFIGTNLAHRLASQGQPVLLFDNLSRAGVERNLAWLQQTHGELIDVQRGDVKNAEHLEHAVSRAGAVFHFAAQVAVTTSLDFPKHDFEVNLRGTLNLLEAIRAQPKPPPLIFTSTNKVYGHLDDLQLQRIGDRYEPRDAAVRRCGVSEATPLQFHSPYGCSKGAADQYVLDYSRCFDLRTVVFRMSCIYGPHQMGTEDQGWVAHFLMKALRNEPLFIYGDGRQVRDILFVEDLVNAFVLAMSDIDNLRGQAFNIGGGPAQTVSLLELLELIARANARRPRVEFAEWRTGDQRYYVSDTRKFRRATGWRPQVGVEAGVNALLDWLRADSDQPARTPVAPRIVRPANARENAALVQP
jgi:CDP-paratose 2-epimerase